eukprot:Skav236720  [mRNA]  locus=scaffold2096:172578:183669:+ [translate_table: standard]
MLTSCVCNLQHLLSPFSSSIESSSHLEESAFFWIHHENCRVCFVQRCSLGPDFQSALSQLKETQRHELRSYTSENIPTAQSEVWPKSTDIPNPSRIRSKLLCIHPLCRGNEGYKLHEEKCIPFACDLETISGCKHCRATHERTADQQCGECDLVARRYGDKGYVLGGSFQCRPLFCNAKTAGCTTCRPQKELTKELRSNDGYGLVNDTCKPYICSPGPGAGCKACKAQLLRGGIIEGQVDSVPSIVHLGHCAWW